MAQYTIYFTTGASASATVEADDLESAIDAAHDVIPYEVCAQCSGWGREYNSLEFGEWEADDKNGYEVDGEWVNGR